MPPDPLPADHVLSVGLNLLFVEPGATGGMETYVRQLVPALAEARPAARLVAFVSRELAAEARPLHDAVEVVEMPVSGASRLRRTAVEQLWLGLAARRAGVQVLHGLASTLPALLPGVRGVVTIHDLNYRLAPDAHSRLLGRGLGVLVETAARRATRVIAGSEATRRGVVELLGVPSLRVDAIPNGPGADPQVAPTPGPQLRRALGIGEEPIIACLSALRPHKNVGRLIEAIARLPHRAALVVAGYRSHGEAALRELAASLGVDGRVVLPGWLPEADLEGLYREATLLAFPSLAEGFGLPVLEAMRRGLPVACANASSLPEVAGDAALLFNPRSVEEIAAAIARLLDDAALRAELAERGRRRAARFSWAATAAATWACYDRAGTD